MIPWLPPAPFFPPVSRALAEPNGLLAAGGDLAPERLLAAYRLGIFPWYAAGEPILWWSPDPRMVLFPAEIKVSRSLRRTLRQGQYQVRLDTAFDDVVAACAGTPRDGQAGTWIVPAMIAAYSAWPAVHSFETWIDGRLAGGLYGVCLGRMFYGESMFAHRSDASKIALAALVCFCRANGIDLIDCQQRTEHLASLGAREIARADFERLITPRVRGPAVSDWVYHVSHWQHLRDAPQSMPTEDLAA